jgi:hypothetical protein
LILLGVLVALGSGGGGGGSSSGLSAVYSQPSGDVPQIPEIRTVEPIIALVAIVAVIALVAIGVALWVVSTIARGGLIAGVSTVDEGQPSHFAQAWRAGWRKGWRLLGIAVIPAIPVVLLLAIALVFGLAAGGFAAYSGEDLVGAPITGLWVVLASLACILIPLALVLGLLRTFADRALVLEDLGVFGSYRRGTQVLLENFGPALVLFLIQIGISIGIVIVGFLPGILLALCCLLWPLLFLIQGAISAFFSTMWTLAWRGWTGLSQVGVAEAPVEMTVE